MENLAMAIKNRDKISTHFLRGVCEKCLDSFPFDPTLCGAAS
eukprot:SAG11_NODE_27925_length_327_cov_0.754386_2_plen_41_part_01